MAAPFPGSTGEITVQIRIFAQIQWLLGRMSLATKRPKGGKSRPPGRLSKSSEHSVGVDVSDVGEASLEQWLQQRLRFGRADDSVIVFIPSHARDKTRLPDQDKWASEALELLGNLYGGATGFTNLRGIWRDDENGGELLDDEPIMIQSLAKRADVEDPQKLRRLADFLKLMGKRTRQGAVAIVINDAIHFITKYE